MGLVEYTVTIKVSNKHYKDSLWSNFYMAIPVLVFRETLDFISLIHSCRVRNINYITICRLFPWWNKTLLMKKFANKTVWKYETIYVCILTSQETHSWLYSFIGLLEIKHGIKLHKNCIANQQKFFSRRHRRVGLP